MKADGKKKTKLERAAEKKIAAKKAKKPGEIKDVMERLELAKYGVSQNMDGSQFRGGSKEMLARFLGDNECMLIWHHPSHSKHKVHVILVWRENSKGKRPRYAGGDAKGLDKYRPKPPPKGLPG